eukprot:GHVS01072990.1.p1 GENE.GHVS01072990.1~~GHVS01072990.1.p1  ORF type:complete len:734 (+),score=130.61 GHVS01072990.1:126-2327(+)
MSLLQRFQLRRKSCASLKSSTNSNLPCPATPPPFTKHGCLSSSSSFTAGRTSASLCKERSRTAGTNMPTGEMHSIETTGEVLCFQTISPATDNATSTHAASKASTIQNMQLSDDYGSATNISNAAYYGTGDFMCQEALSPEPTSSVKGNPGQVREVLVSVYETASGEIYSVPVSTVGTVGDLKTTLSQYVDIHPSHQKLSLDGVELTSSSLISATPLQSLVSLQSRTEESTMETLSPASTPVFLLCLDRLPSAVAEGGSEPSAGPTNRAANRYVCSAQNKSTTAGSRSGSVDLGSLMYSRSATMSAESTAKVGGGGQRFKCANLENDRKTGEEHILDEMRGGGQEASAYHSSGITQHFESPQCSDMSNMSTGVLSQPKSPCWFRVPENVPIKGEPKEKGTSGGRGDVEQKWGGGGLPPCHKGRQEGEEEVPRAQPRGGGGTDSLLASQLKSTTSRGISVEEERRRLVQQNYLKALDLNPEAFCKVVMLYIDMEVNGVGFKAFVDSGAQMTIMTKRAATRANIDYLIDHRFHGLAKGVGAAPIIGRIHMAEISLSGKWQGAKKEGGGVKGSQRSYSFAVDSSGGGGGEHRGREHGGGVKHIQRQQSEQRQQRSSTVATSRKSHPLPTRQYTSNAGKVTNCCPSEKLGLAENEEDVTVNLFCSFTIMGDQDVDIILGLDMLMKHECVVDLRHHVLNMGDIVVPFLAEKDIQGRTQGKTDEAESGETTKRVVPYTT